MKSSLLLGYTPMVGFCLLTSVNSLNEINKREANLICFIVIYFDFCKQNIDFITPQKSVKSMKIIFDYLAWPCQVTIVF